MLTNNERNNSKGYSLIELIITITLTSIVMVIFYTVFGQNQVRSVSTIMQVKASELGQAYLEEISLKRYDEKSPVGNSTPCISPNCSAIGKDGTEVRTTFNDVDDYDGINESPPIDALGATRTGFNNFRVQISVSYAGGTLGLGLALQDVKKIEVTVFPPDFEGGQFIFTQYRGNF